MKFPFEANADELAGNLDLFVDSVSSCLVSESLVMPKGDGFLDYGTFAAGYEELKKTTDGFAEFESRRIVETIIRSPVSFVVLRTILGFTPPEWAYIAANRKGVDIPQNAARSLDRDIRKAPHCPLNASPLDRRRISALVETACEVIGEGCPSVPADKLHRLDKADSSGGTGSVRRAADLGVPYAMLLYERFLGRPFAGHRDSVSELVGDAIESAIEDELTKAGVTFRKTKRAERIPGFDQAPDFIVPDEFNPCVVIEAKLTEDDGTARDKTTRIIRLCQMAEQRLRDGLPGYQVIACLAGRGFGVRREDMRQMIVHTKGKVFTPKTLNRLVEHSELSKFRSRQMKP